MITIQIMITLLLIVKYQLTNTRSRNATDEHVNIMTL